MPILAPQVEGCPNADEIRAALGHMAASEAFRGSPQLVAFLRYVVEATLRGEQDRIKGYTIAVEALGRGDDFNPQLDPIVRVEATRLRRALNRYYANGGRQDPVQIDLPPGSYVPSFRRYTMPPARPALPPAPARPRQALRWAGANWRSLVAGATLALFGAGVYGGVDLWLDFNAPNAQTALFLATPSRAAIAPRPPATPVIFVGTFYSDGKSAAGRPEVDALRSKLRDALARFDEVQIIAGMPPAIGGVASDPESVSQYMLTASLPTDEAGATSVRLTDIADGQVAYARTFARVPPGGEDAIVREVSTALAQPYGIIQARERAKEAGGETQYRCLLEAYGYWRHHDPQRHAGARDCLERATETSPGFALGYAALAAIILDEARDGDPTALQRALLAARRAVELRPGSARAHQALAEVQFARGDYPLAIEAGERAVTLNPYDPIILASHGGMLVSLGEQARGAQLIRQAAATLVVRPVWHDFLLFLTAYLADDAAGAARYAAMITSDAYPLGLVARALVAVQRGETEAARQLLARLGAARPAWRNDCRAELAKYFPAAAIVDRIERDIAQIRAIPGQ
jgi:tetratricopeptide (TPR) repeat protein